MSSYELHAKRAFSRTAGPLVAFEGILVTPGHVEITYRIYRSGMVHSMAVKAEKIGRKAVELAAETVGKWAANKAEA